MHIAPARAWAAHRTGPSPEPRAGRAERHQRPSTKHHRGPRAAVLIGRGSAASDPRTGDRRTRATANARI
eukprot:4299278-Prymnesium_polylepis.1